MSVLHIELFENLGDEDILAKTDASASAVFIVVDFDAEELACRAEIGDCGCFLESGLNFDHSFRSIFWLQH